MLDIQLLRKDLPAVIAGLKRRGFDFDEAAFRALEEERKRVQSRTEELQGKLKALSKQIGMLKGQGKHDEAAAVMKEVGGLGDEVKANESVLAAVQEKQAAFLRVVPNMLRAEVPDGRSAEQNVEVRRWGEPRKLGFPAKDHVDIGAGLAGIDFETAAKLAGSRFYVLKGPVARLHRAIAQLMLQVHTEEHGYQEVYVPYMVTGECADGPSSLAKFKDDLFKIEGRDLYLIPTSEYSVTNFLRDTIVEGKDLPHKYTCYSPCFRSEAGSYGKDTRGMIRVHQFDKVEILRFERPEDSAEAHEELVRHAEAILQRLELPYRTMLLCAGDTGFASAKTYDLEVWLPGQQAYREISSCSNFEAFQARRMQARLRNAQGKTEPLHTLNGSGLAVGRTLVAVLENYQNADGSVTIPKALVPFMGGTTTIPARGA
jgi:seryl-tRNA synthetase